MKKRVVACIAIAAFASSALAVVQTNTLQWGGDDRDSGWDDNWVTNSLVSPPEYSITLSPPAEYTELSNLTFTVTFTETNGIPLLAANNWLCATIDDGAIDRRLNSNEVLRLKVSYSDPDNVLLGLGVSQFGAELNTTDPWETTVFSVGATSYSITNSNDLVNYDSTGLTPLTTNNVDTWEMLVSVEDYITELETNLTLSAMGGFALKYIADSDYVPPLPTPEPVLFDFVDGGEFDNKGTNVTMSVTNNVGGVITIKTEEIIGLDGTSTTNGTSNKTNIQSVNALGINSANFSNTDISNESRDFNPGEAWVISFDKDVYLAQIDMASEGVDTEMTISSPAFPDFVLLGLGGINTNGTWDLSNTVVSAGTLVTFQMTSTTNASDTQLRIDDITVGLAEDLVDPYDAWVADQGLTNGVNAAYGDDPDNDQLVNLLEYACGGTALTDDAAIYGPTFQIVADGGTNTMNYIYRRRTDRAAVGLTYTVGSATSLSGGGVTNSTFEAGFGPAGDAGFELVTNRVPMDVEDQQFIQLKVSLD